MFRDSCTWSWICILQLLFVHMIIINCCYGSIRDANMFENCQEKQKILFTRLMVAIVLKKQPNVVVCWSQVQQLLGTHHENKRKPQGFPTEFCNVLCKRNACSFHMAIFNFLALHSIAIICLCILFSLFISPLGKSFTLSSQTPTSNSLQCKAEPNYWKLAVQITWKTHTESIHLIDIILTIRKITVFLLKQLLDIKRYIQHYLLNSLFICATRLQTS